MENHYRLMLLMGEGLLLYSINSIQNHYESKSL